MRRTALNSVLAALALFVAACSSNPSPAAPAPQPAPAPAPAPAAARYVLAGEWEWSSTFQGQLYSGTMTLELSGGSYTGTMRVSGQFDATVRTASLSGNTVQIVLDSPQGEMVLEAQFTDANTLTGRVDVVAAGDAATFSATRR
jgi:hypothetical protein